MSDEADIASKSDRDVDEEEKPGTLGVRMVSRAELEEDVGKYRHCEARDSDRVSHREEKETYPDEESIDEEKEDISAPSYQGLDLISEHIDEEAIGEDMKESTVEELVKEELDGKTEIISLRKKILIHPIDRESGNEEGCSGHHE